MKAIVCEMCGSQDLVKQDGMYVCQNCGTKYDPEEAKKLLIEVSGEVKVNNKEKVENYRILARRARDNNNAPDAAKYYDLIRAEEPNDWESSFFSVYYQAIQTRVMNVRTYTDALDEAATTSMAIAATTLEKEEEVESAITTIFLYFNIFCEAVFETCEKGYTDSWPNVSSNYTEEHIYRIINLYLKLIGLGNGTYKVFSDKPKLKELCLIPYKEAINIGSKYDVNNKKRTGRAINGEILKPVFDIIPRVQEFEPSYTPPYFPSNPSLSPDKSSSNSDGCYVATAVYGSYDCPEVWTLRRYRDYKLAETWYGRAFIHTYYAISPTLVKWFGQTEWFRNMWKPTLDRMVKRLTENGVLNTPYQDRQW